MFLVANEWVLLWQRAILARIRATLAAQHLSPADAFQRMDADGTGVLAVDRVRPGLAGLGVRLGPGRRWGPPESRGRMLTGETWPATSLGAEPPGGKFGLLACTQQLGPLRCWAPPLSPATWPLKN